MLVLKEKTHGRPRQSPSHLHWRNSLKSFHTFAALTILCASSACASTVYTFVNSSGSNSYEAIFTVSAGDLNVQIENFQSAAGDDTGLISSLLFTLSGSPGTITTPTSYSGGEVADANSNGTLTQLYSALTQLPSSDLAWQNTGSNTNIDLTALSGGKPSDLIMGAAPSGSGGVYNGGSLNSSIIQHNPEIIGPADFDFSVSGITPSTVVSGVTFGQGTSTGTESASLQSTLATPEPATWAMFLGGAGLLALRRRYHTRQALGATIASPNLHEKAC